MAHCQSCLSQSMYMGYVTQNIIATDPLTLCMQMNMSRGWTYEFNMSVLLIGICKSQMIPYNVQYLHHYLHRITMRSSSEQYGL